MSTEMNLAINFDRYVHYRPIIQSKNYYHSKMSKSLFLFIIYFDFKIVLWKELKLILLKSGFCVFNFLNITLLIILEVTK